MIKKNSKLCEFIKMLMFMKKRLWIYFAAVIISSAANSGFTITLAFVNRELINTAVSRHIGKLYNIVIPAVAAFILICCIFPMFIFIKVVTIRKTITELKSELFNSIIKLPMADFQKKHSGYIISLLTNDINVVDNALNNQIQVIAISIFGGIGSAAAMFTLNWRLSLLAVVLGIISACVNAAFADSFREVADKLQNSLADIMQYLTSFIEGLRIIKIFNVGEITSKGYIDSSTTVRALTIARFKKNAALDSINYILSCFNLFGVFAAGIYMAAGNKASIGDVTAIITLQGGLNYMLLNFGDFFAQLQGSLAGSARLLEALH